MYGMYAQYRYIKGYSIPDLFHTFQWCGVHGQLTVDPFRIFNSKFLRVGSRSCSS